MTKKQAVLANPSQVNSNHPTFANSYKLLLLYPTDEGVRIRWRPVQSHLSGLPEEARISPGRQTGDDSLNSPDTRGDPSS